MVRNNCTNCWNSCGDYCTCQLDMDKAKHRKCRGWKEVTHKPKKQEFSLKRFTESKRIRLMKGMANVEKVSSKFQDFIKKGGHYSCRTGKLNSYQ